MKLIMVPLVAGALALTACTADNNEVVESPNTEENTSPAMNTGIEDGTGAGTTGAGTGTGTGTGAGTTGAGTGTGTGATAPTTTE